METTLTRARDLWHPLGLAHLAGRLDQTYCALAVAWCSSSLKDFQENPGTGHKAPGASKGRFESSTVPVSSQVVGYHHCHTQVPGQDLELSGQLHHQGQAWGKEQTGRTAEGQGTGLGG